MNPSLFVLFTRFCLHGVSLVSHRQTHSWRCSKKALKTSKKSPTSWAIQAFDRLDQDSGRILLKGLDEKSLYDAALTVMMRLVFLFSAEERGLLHLNEQLYDDNYAVSTLREQLQGVADQYGEEVLERRHDGWARLLASFRAVHGGVNHQDLMLPAYGGSLFDPDRYPFLEGRTQGTLWQSSPAAPLEINNRVVLHLLKSLQMLQVKVPGGGPAEALRVSFEGLNIEQIGHVYEGLLDHSAVRAKEVVLGLAASRKKPVASMALAELEKLRQDDEAKLIEVLQEETGRSAKALGTMSIRKTSTRSWSPVVRTTSWPNASSCFAGCCDRIRLSGWSLCCQEEFMSVRTARVVAREHTILRGA
jgi:hypothetical protein